MARRKIDQSRDKPEIETMTAKVPASDQDNSKTDSIKNETDNTNVLESTEKYALEKRVNGSVQEALQKQVRSFFAHFTNPHLETQYQSTRNQLFN